MNLAMRVGILGAGQIGRAVHEIISHLSGGVKLPGSMYNEISTFIIDSSKENIAKLGTESGFVMDFESAPEEDIAKLLIEQGATHVINALPFVFNQKVASAAAAASCSYIDFTEDDIMADSVQAIYRNTGLDCAVKCGLAPGFINYIGYDLVRKIDLPDSLMISVGALPRSVSYDRNRPEYSYNLSWSVDGLVNEYIRPCRIKRNGKIIEVPALGQLVTVVLDGIEYEAAHTSGGVGSLIRDLSNVPNVHYKTLRYPGHYRYVRNVVQENYGNFDKIKKIFLDTFPFTDDDVIVVYADALGKDSNGTAVRKSYFNKFYGINGLTGIQSTTASSGVAMLELMFHKKVSGIINHSDIDLDTFSSMEAFRHFYNTRK